MEAKLLDLTDSTKARKTVSGAASGKEEGAKNFKQVRKSNQIIQAKAKTSER